MDSDKLPVMDAPVARWSQEEFDELEFRASQKTTGVVRVGVIGYGYWGPNVVRNFHGLEDCRVVAVCDKSTDALRRVGRAYPQIRLTTDFTELLTSPEIDAIAVVTPVWTHFDLAKAALENG